MINSSTFSDQLSARKNQEGMSLALNRLGAVQIMFSLIAHRWRLNAYGHD
jgi:hypothetical protein